MQVKIENRRTFWGSTLKPDDVVCLQSNQCSLEPTGIFFPHCILKWASKILLQLILKITFEHKKEIRLDIRMQEIDFD